MKYHKSTYRSMRTQLMTRLLPLLLLAVVLVVLFTYTVARHLLRQEYESQVEAVVVNAKHALELIDSGYDMLDRHLEVQMSEVIREFKVLYEASDKPVNLEQLKQLMGGEYDLMIIDQETTIVDSTMPEAVNFNFVAFDAAIGEKINQIRLSDSIVHERLRTNVGTGLITKFTYLSADNHHVLLEISYSEPVFASLVESLEPIRRMNEIRDAHTIVDEIVIYDVYGFQYSHGGEAYKPSEETLNLVKRAIEELFFRVDLETGTKRVYYIPDSMSRPLSDHSRILAITFNTNYLKDLQWTLAVVILIGTLLAVLAFSWILYHEINSMTKPLNRLTLAAKEVVSGNYKVQLPVSGTEETAYLTTVFNEMIQVVNEHYTDLSKQFKTTLYSMVDGVVVTDSTGKVILMNPSAEELLELTEFDSVGQLYQRVLGIENEEGVSEFGSVERFKEYMYTRLDGQNIPLAYTRADLEDGGQVFVIRDMTEHLEKIHRIQFLSHNDQLTGVLNRRAFELHSLDSDAEGKLPQTLLMVDLNGLKLVNDAFGHTLGDQLLQQAARVLRVQVGNRGELYRIGGDEFVAILDEVTLESVRDIVDAIERAARETDVLPAVLSLSIGSATRDSFDESLSELFVRAEKAMYHHKLSESIHTHRYLIDQVTDLYFERQPNAKAHAQRVMERCNQWASRLDLNWQSSEHLMRAAWYHDIGKVNLPLDDQGEIEEDNRHVQIGYQILRSVTVYAMCAEIVLSHHENWDGTGFPRGLKGNDIPIEAQILGLCDYCDHLEFTLGLDQEAIVETVTNQSDKAFSAQLIGLWKKAILMERSDETFE